MRKIFLIISFIVAWSMSFAQTFTPPRSSSVITVQDSRYRALLNFYQTHTHGINMNGGLDSLGMTFYEDSSGHIFYRDTVLTGGHKWSWLLKNGDAGIGTVRKVIAGLGFLPLTITDSGTFNLDTAFISNFWVRRHDSTIVFVTPTQMNAQGFLKNITGISAGGDLTGTYPNPTINLNAVTFAKIQQIPGFSFVANPTASLANPQASYFKYGLLWNNDSVKVDTATLKTVFGATGVGGITQLTGDGTTPFGSGPQPFTLATVNANVYGPNTFLKFAPNAKGLVLSATPVLGSDITGALGFIPIPLTALSATLPIVYDNTTGIISCPTCGSSSGGISSLNGLTSANQLFAIGYSGTSFNIGSSGITHTFNTPLVNSADTGLATPALYNSWNAKASVPSAGLVYSTGSALADVTVLAPLIYSAGILSADTVVGGQNLATQGFVTRNTVASVSNIDGTLTISPTSGAAVASLNLAHANTWTASPTFAANLLFNANLTYNIGSTSAYGNNFYFNTWNSSGINVINSASGSGTQFKVNLSIKDQMLSTGQWSWDAYAGNTFPGSSADSLVTYNNKLINVTPVSTLYPTWQQSLTKGSTLNTGNTVVNTGQVFTWNNGGTGLFKLSGFIQDTANTFGLIGAQNDSSISKLSWANIVAKITPFLPTFNIYPVNGLQPLGNTLPNDSLGLGGTLYQNTTISGSNAFALILDSMHAATGHGFKVNFGSDAPWDLATRDSITGFWTRVPKGSPGQFFHMSLSGGYDWAVPGGGGTVSSVGLSLPASLFTVTGSPVTGSGTLTGAFATSSPGFLPIGDTTTGIISVRHLVVKDIPAFSNYPAQQPVGTIIDESNWTTTDAHWGLVSGTSAISFSGTNPVLPTLTSTTNSFSNTIAYLPYRPTLLSNWQDSIWWKLTSAPNSLNFFGPAILSTNTHATISYKCYMNTSTGAMVIADNSGTTMASGSGPSSISLNDQFLFTFSMNDSTLTWTAKDITAGSATFTVSKTFSLSTAGPFIPNNANWGFLLSGTGTYQIQRIKISSNETRFPNVLIAGASQAISVGANFFASSFPETLGTTWPIIDRYAAGGGQSADMINLMPEIKMIDAETIIWFGEGANDIRYGLTEAATQGSLQSMVNNFAGTSTKQYISLVPEDSTAGGQGLSPLHQWLAAGNLIGCTYIDVWGVLAGGTNIVLAKYSAGDGKHLNQAGSNVVDSIYRAQGIIGVLDPSRRSPFRAYAHDKSPIGDSLSLDYKIDRGQDRLLMSDDTGNIVPSPWVYKNGFMTFSTNQTAAPTPFGTSGVVINNANLILNGALGAVVWQDRTTPTNQKSIYHNNNALTFNSQGTDYAHFNTNGDFDLTNTGTAYNPLAFGGFYVNRTKTIAGLQMTKGGAFTSDSTPYTFTGAGPVPLTGPLEIYSALITVPGSAISFTKSFAAYFEAPHGGGTAILADNQAVITIGGIEMNNGSLWIKNPTTGNSSMAVLVLNQSNGQVDTVAQSSLGGGVTTVGTFSGSSQTNGASISTNTITFGPADATNPGMVTTGNQTLAGNKLFSSTLEVGGSTVNPGPTFTIDGNNTSILTTSWRGAWFNLVRGNTHTETSTGTISIGGSAYFGDGTFSAGSAVTYTNAATLIINAAPTAGTNVTITNPWSLYVAAGNSFFNGNTTIAANSSLTAGHVVGNSGSPGIAAGTGAGTGPTVALTGTDQDGLISVTTGTTPSLSATVVTVTYNFAYPTNTFPVLTPANSNAALLSGVTMVFTAGSTTTFIITSGTTALTSATQYKWFYHVGAN